jgi:hypothetical protein
VWATKNPHFNKPIGVNMKQSAFPISGSQYRHTEGMTLRDYFAAKAMQEFIRIDSETTFFGMPHPDANLKCSINAYAMADAMLKARGE